jgi:transposase
MRRQYARSQKGTRAYSQVSAQRGKNVTLIGGLTYQGFIAPMTWQGGTNGTTFQTYIDKILVPQLWEGACVVMDNFSSHLISGVRESIEAVGAKLVYLSPYSPDFSPIENCWSKLKTSIRAQAVKTYEELNQAVAIALDQITQKDLIGWFTHCCYCIQCN